MRLIVEPNLGWSPEYREKNCPGLVEALRVIAQMIDEGWYFVMLFAWHIVDSLERGLNAGVKAVKARIEAERQSKKVRVVIVIDDFEHARLISTSANVDKDMCEIIVTPIRGK